MRSIGNEYLVLRDDDPARADVEARGYKVVGESWAARLRLHGPSRARADAPDLSIFHQAVARVQAAGIDVSELPVTCLDALYELERANNADYPYTPATAHGLIDADATRALWNEGLRVFGARDGNLLVGASLIAQMGTYAETEFTSVLASHRGRGIGAAVKAASVIACAGEGGRVFGTGGAAVNAGSLGMNRALGYIITERWYSYQLLRR